MPSTSATQTLLRTLDRFLAEGVPPKPWGIGYSGGRDSTVLVWALCHLVGPQDLRALHVDHGWRSAEERGAEARLIDDQCLRWGVPVEHFAPPAVVVATEDGARRHRYRCFAQFLEGHPASPVWLAHHADDQAETILMRLLKGRSWQGLGGMEPRRGPFLRPLLGLRSSLLARVADEEHLAYHEDSTNWNLGPTRNYLRKKVFPGLERRFPTTVSALGAFGEVWRQVRPQTELDPRWVATAQGGELPTAVWDSWSAFERQIQLAAVAEAAGTPRPLSRRFLETLARDGRTEPSRGAGWSWSRSTASVRWRRVVQASTKEYFILVAGEGSLDVGPWTLGWASAPRPGSVAVRGTSAPWVLRSTVDGMRYASEEGEWGREGRRKRLGASHGPFVLVTQNGLIRAVVDWATGTLVWTEMALGKLHNGQIFVTLTKRSEYERR